jgi:hypothetical protein
MGMIGDHKIVLDKRLASSRYEWQLIGGDGSSFSIHFYTKSTDDGHILTSLTEGSDFKDTEGTAFPTKVYTWTGAGTIIDALGAWRSANPSVTEGGMFNFWNEIPDSGTYDLSASRTSIAATIVEGQADSDHLQTVLDANADA